jgi:hypothetical protein
MEEDMEGSGSDLIEILLQHLPAGTEENHNKTCVSIAGTSADIRTEHLPNNVRKRYVYINLLGTTTSLRRILLAEFKCSRHIG